MEPVAVVAIADIENLQSEVSRLRQILDDHNMSHTECTVTMDSEKNESDLDPKVKVKSTCIRQRLKQVVGGSVKALEHQGSRSNVVHEQMIEESSGETEDESSDDTKSGNICSYINSVLNKRLEQVINKKRSKDFTVRYKKHLDAIDGEFTIVSLHGRDEEQNHLGGADDEEQKVIVANKVHFVPDDDHEKSFFPEDLLSLDMVFTEKVYDMAMKEIEKKHENLIMDHHSMYTKEIMFIPKLIFRAMHLGFNFAPVTLTLSLASFSKDFREKVWYNLVGRCLAKSGPAFIKWGKSPFTEI